MINSFLVQNYQRK